MRRLSSGSSLEHAAHEDAEDEVHSHDVFLAGSPFITQDARAGARFITQDYMSQAAPVARIGVPTVRADAGAFSKALRSAPVWHGAEAGAPVSSVEPPNGTDATPGGGKDHSNDPEVHSHAIFLAGSPFIMQGVRDGDRDIAQGRTVFTMELPLPIEGANHDRRLSSSQEEQAKLM